MANRSMQMLIARVESFIKRTEPDSPALRTALIRIGVVVSSQVKINIRRQRLIDTGRLINSVAYEYFREGGTQGIRVGSFGVPYAAIHEFGYQGSVQIRQHARLVKNGKPPRKVQVGAHTRMMRIRPRPYLRPAVDRHKNFIIDTIRGAYQNG